MKLFELKAMMSIEIDDVRDDDIKQVEKFKYLETRLTEQDGCQEER